MSKLVNVGKIPNLVGNFLKDTFQRKIVFFTGKGGVGKSTLCFATALAAKRNGRRPLVAVWEPFETPRGEHPLDRLGINRLRLETLACFKEYALLTLKFEKLYDTVFDNHVLRTFIKTTPGVSDGVIGGKLWDIAQKDDYDLILVDLPSTGHAVSFFRSPIGIKKVFSVGAIHRQATEILRYFESEKTRVDVVSLPEELPLTESRELVQKLNDTLKLHFGFYFLNQLTPRFAIPSSETLSGKWKELGALYEARWSNDDEAKKIVSEFGLPTITIDFQPLAQETSIVETMATLLEQA